MERGNRESTSYGLDRPANDSDDDDDGSSPEWFDKPYKNISLAKRVENMTTDQEIEEEMADSRSDLECNWKSEEQQESALFGDSQHLIGNTLHQAEIIENQQSNVTSTHSSYIFVPEVSAMVHKAKVIKELAENKMVSFNPLIRVQQARENRESSSCKTSADDDDERYNVGL